MGGRPRLASLLGRATRDNGLESELTMTIPELRNHDPIHAGPVPAGRSTGPYRAATAGCAAVTGLTWFLIAVAEQVVLPDSMPGGVAERLAAIESHSTLWARTVVAALGLGVAGVVATFAVLARLRRTTPRWAAITAVFLVPGMVGLAMHGAYYNTMFGAFALATNDRAAVAAVVGHTEGYRPFWVALGMMYLLEVGLLLLAVASWRSRLVPRAAACCFAVFPIADLIGAEGWLDVAASGVLALGWIAWAIRLARPDDATQARRHPLQP